ncbi:65-kDa microtubule-associated protein 3-like [Chenopodium quinoa]|uniref:65-kDa microtubule-associated protein 3-like n=1 Tax=Chenopodium quinoa TaxID=63459 RepID=UPI000B777D00|nr:65-kDa microtubule-associated protein 3-like [Chenopodium quinoa]
MAVVPTDPITQVETTCGSLLYELQIIWDEVGESETARDKMLLELEQECLEVYRRKVDQANRCRAQLLQAIADSEAELAAICSAMVERPVHIRQTEQKAGSLKEELDAILPQLEEMRKSKIERKNQFLDVIGQIQKVSTEIYGLSGYDSCTVVIDENDLSLRRLEELQNKLQSLQKEKSDRLKLVMEHLNDLSSLCSVLGLDFKGTVRELHPSLADSEESHSISTETLKQLESAIFRLRELKLQRMQKLQDLATMLIELWNLMDTPFEEQQPFQHVTCNIAASEDEITEPNVLSEDCIKYVEAEVSRLEQLKSSKMKELVMKKRTELEEICRKTHLVPEADCETEHLMAAIESGALDPASVLEQIESEVSKVKEEAYSRKEILEKVEKWLSAREEEEWLEQYNQDDNRYNASRGAHLTLKRAEKARSLVNKLPGMVEALAAKAHSWENERGVEFMYDGVRLLSMLEEYMILRQEKELEKKRQREQKKLQGQINTEQEALFGSKPSPLKSAKKPSRRMSMGGPGGGPNRRLSLGGNMHQTPRPDSSHSTRATPSSRSVRKDDNNGGQSTARRALDIANLPTRNFTFSGRESDPTTVARRPFSPISSVASSRANGDFFDDQNILQNNSVQKSLAKNETSQKVASVSNTSVVTPSKKIPAGDEENHTPNKMLFPPPTTPMTVSAPMQTSMTPAPSKPLFGDNLVGEKDEEIEYSFEERRAGFVLPSTHLRRALQV